MSSGPHLPRNLLDEIETALRESPAEIDGDRERALALKELHLIVRGLSFELARPVTLSDVVQHAWDDCERAHRQELLRLLRPPM
jgi:hypothetical protein